MDFKYINGKNNPFYKKIKKLKQKKYRMKEKLFLAEGDKFLEQANEAKHIIISEKLKNEFDFKEMIILEKNLFRELSSQENSQGVILVFKVKECEITNIRGNIVVLDGIQDPGNMGTIIRTCEASGFQDVILVEECVDVHNEKCVRSTMGAINSVNLYNFSRDEIVKFIQKEDYFIIASALTEKSADYRKIYTRKKSALVFGNEGQGISKEILDISHQLLKIPIYGNSDSLNVSVATGIILYQFIENEVKK